MPNPLVAVAGLGAVGGVASASAQASAASDASAAQVESTELGIEEQRRQFDIVQGLLAPYVGAGTDAISQQMSLLGLGGADAQAAAISAIESGPQMAALQQQGENAILQNASATGGLRGGNTQGALAQFRPQLLNSLIDQQYSRLGGLAGLGQASAAGTGAAAQSTGNNISGLLQQQGAALAGNALAQGQAQANAFGSITGAAGFLGGQMQVPEGASVFGKWGF